MYIDETIRDYLNMIQSNQPIPGGGSVSALVSSLGGALTLMTSNHSFEKEYFKNLDPKIQDVVRQCHEDIINIKEELNEFIDDDAKGFNGVIKAYNMSDYESDENNKARLEAAYKKALSAPLKSSRKCVDLLKLQSIIVEHGNQETISDVGVGVVLAYAALEGSIMTVKINLNYIKDEKYVKEIKEELNDIYNEATRINEFLREKIDGVLEDL